MYFNSQYSSPNGALYQMKHIFVISITIKTYTAAMLAIYSSYLYLLIGFYG